MGFSVKVDLSNFDRRFSRQNLINARKLAANDALQVMNSKYVPKLSGDLRKESFINSDGSEIIWKAPYALIQYQGWRHVSKDSDDKVYFHQWSEPGTGPKWDQKLTANKDDMKSIMDTFTKGLEWKPK